MYHASIRFLLMLVISLPAFALAATDHTIHAEWTSYTAPAGYTLSGYRLYQEGSLACQTQNASATSLDCTVPLAADTTNFTLTAAFSDGSESPHSSPFAFSKPATPPPPPTSSTTSIHAAWSSYTAPSGYTVTGFNLYQEGVLACQTQNPAATSLDCTVSLAADTTNFTLTAAFSDGSESPHSTPFTYTVANVLPQAVLTANTTSGAAPLPVQFNATSSTGSIASYAWDFGDGATSSGATVSHTYAAAGTYTAKLTVTDTSGKISSATKAIAVIDPAVSLPPTAIISSSTALGQAPLTVSFNGASSSAAGGKSLVSYAWSFGDGTTATGANASHSFTSPGSYTTSLTVTDDKGLTDSADTPIVVTVAQSPNQMPAAVISTSVASGSAPLGVSFDGSASSDPDGSIASYVWNFGDGGTATGKTATHTYTTNGTFTATLKVTDNQGASTTSNTTISVQPESQQPGMNFEIGEVAVSHQWIRVAFTSTFKNPIVVAGPPSYSDADPCTVRIRNVNATGFEIRIEEWNYLNTIHNAESVTYLVMEKGRITLPNGSMVEAGSFIGTTTFKAVPFNAPLANIPVVLSTVASTNESETIGGRLRNIGKNGFEYSFREQEANTNGHVNETVNYIAWEPGQGTVGTVQFEAANTYNKNTHNWSTWSFKTTYPKAPMLLADIQTTYGSDSSALRKQQVTPTGFQAMIEEEQSSDAEIWHPGETVGYLALNQKEQPKVSATFSWTFNATQEATINGFQVLVNGEQVCTVNDPKARQATCVISAPAAMATFSVQAIEKTGGASAPSNTITYTP